MSLTSAIAYVTNVVDKAVEHVESSYKARHSLEVRKVEAKNIRERYPDRIPVIVEKSGRNVPQIDKTKFLVPMDLTVGQFVYTIRRRLALPPETAMFIFCGNSLPNTSSLMSEIYEQYADECGFLFLSYSGENIFGRLPA
jgi:GABA(A) receptor-associated protein